jgi:divalent metal cation (Fe/Co/Zn/Cd) transporter
MSASEDPVVTHEIIDHIEREILEQINVNLVIHFDPVMKDD